MARKMKPNVFAKYVNSYVHPGIPARPYLRPALQKGYLLLQKLLPKALARINQGGKPDIELDAIVRTAAYMVQATASRLAPKRTGNLRRSINTQKRGELFYTIGTNVEYAAAQEFGVKPFTMPRIYPKNKRCLAWHDELSNATKRRG